MAVYHNFEFVDERNDCVIAKINIEDIFLDYVMEQQAYEVDCLYNLIPSINPGYVKEPYKSKVPSEKGLNYCGISVINHYSFDYLKKIFLEWIDILEKLDDEYYYPYLVDLNEDQLAEISFEEMKGLKETFFVKSEVLKKLNICMHYLETMNSPDIVIYYYGI